MTTPPSAIFANRSSVSSRLEEEYVIAKLLPICIGRPNVDGMSLPISTLEPMGNDTCMMLSRSSSGTLASEGRSAKVDSISKSPPKTDR